MRYNSPILALHEALASALLLDLPAIQQEHTDWAAIEQDRKRLGAGYEEFRKKHGVPVQTRPRRPAAEEVEVQVFNQLWGSTATGYGGLGGSAMTNAYTVIVGSRNCICVYFGCGALAYKLSRPEMTPEQLESWNADLDARQVGSRRHAVKSYGAKVPGSTEHLDD